ncbi:FKBP-type peptidyl-prolyl cis-trans isomerase [Roseivirga sp.]|uniref:FKBP-type peptidyl-prolyl cis-trans isomerase n=1 Tax=Roseivirga sp. TaxID=1964215 RepID=UPI003B8B44EA
MKSFIYSTLVLVFLTTGTVSLNAQKVTERYESGAKKYQGKIKKGRKSGKHEFWYESGQIQKEEKYDKRGILIQVKEWDEDGKLTKDFNPEKAVEKIRSKQFSELKWFLVRDGLSYYKTRGKQVYQPITGRQNMMLNYATYTMSGKEVDSSFRRKDPINVQLIGGPYIKGFLMALGYFEPGDTGYIRIPSELAYGRLGTTNVPANAVLVFQVSIISVN